MELVRLRKYLKIAVNIFGMRASRVANVSKMAPVGNREFPVKNLNKSTTARPIDGGRARNSLSAIESRWLNVKDDLV